MFLLFANLGTLDFATIVRGQGMIATPLMTAICLFMFLGCAGKSAQLPLYVWLPDAMAGPTPVSALIHAATMVTAGIYLIVRNASLFAAAPAACLVIVLVGALTAIWAASVGLKQWDIKKVLAYSTVSQLGYMFVAVGAGAYTAGMFHLVTHAFFKALLFPGAGAVIHSMPHALHASHRHDDAQDMRNMGGLMRRMPSTATLMWIATLAIAGIPPLAGFFSKDAILSAIAERAMESPLAESSLGGIPGRAILWLAYGLGLITAFMTAIYMTRLMRYTFHGRFRSGEDVEAQVHDAPWVLRTPLVVLGALTLVGGWLQLPEVLPFLGGVVNGFAQAFRVVGVAVFGCHVEVAQQYQPGVHCEFRAHLFAQRVQPAHLVGEFLAAGLLPVDEIAIDHPQLAARGVQRRGEHA